MGSLFSTSLSFASLWPSKRLFFTKNLLPSGKDSSVGIAIRYGLDGPGIESRWGRDFPRLSRPALGPTSIPHNGYKTFYGVKWTGRGVGHPPYLEARLKQE